MCVCVRALHVFEIENRDSDTEVRGESQNATTVQYERCMCTQCVHVQMLAGFGSVDHDDVCH